MKTLLALLTVGIGSLALNACSTTSPTASAPLRVNASDKDKLAKAIWKNECAGTISGLTSWNNGEEFPSLGIGHFIWYPSGKKGIYEESFPAFIRFARQAGARPPEWTSGACPWQTRAEFQKEINGPRLTSLRQWLASTTALQADFIIARSAAALPKLMAQSCTPEKIKARYNAVATTPNGIYALIDYVNFKGEGTNPAERYKGEGWGLAQVLDTMPDVPAGQVAAKAFSQAAKKILARRVSNSPSERGESRWLPGWQNRCDTYARSL